MGGFPKLDLIRGSCEFAFGPMVPDLFQVYSKMHSNQFSAVF